MASNENCEHGKWVGGICKCDEGYITEFTNEELYPKYCTKKYENVPIVLKGSEIKDVFHYLAISATLLLFISGVMVFAYFWYTMLESWLLGLRIAEAKRRLEKFRSSVIRRGPDEDLRAEIWYPDMNEYICVNDPSFTIEKAIMAEMEKKRIMCAKVTHEYLPKKPGELKLEEGDIITNVVKLKSGWCKGKLDGKSGYFSEAYVQLFETMAGEDGKPILTMADYMVQSQNPSMADFMSQSSHYFDSRSPSLTDYTSQTQSHYFDSRSPSIAGSLIAGSTGTESIAGETTTQEPMSAGPMGARSGKNTLLRSILEKHYKEQNKQLVEYWQQGVVAGGGEYPGVGDGQYPGVGDGQYPGVLGGQYPGISDGQYPGFGGRQFPGIDGYGEGYDYDKIMGAGESWYDMDNATRSEDKPTDAPEDEAEQDPNGNKEQDRDSDNDQGEEEQEDLEDKDNDSDEEDNSRREQDDSDVEDQESKSEGKHDFDSEEDQDYDGKEKEYYGSEEKEEYDSEEKEEHVSDENYHNSEETESEEDYNRGEKGYDSEEKDSNREDQDSVDTQETMDKKS